jgi:hypothetical protein
MAGKAGPRPPVEAAYLDIYASGALENGGVAVSRLVDDSHPAARAKDPDGLAQRPGAFFATRSSPSSSPCQTDSLPGPVL